MFLRVIVCLLQDKEQEGCVSYVEPAKLKAEHVARQGSTWVYIWHKLWFLLMLQVTRFTAGYYRFLQVTSFTYSTVITTFTTLTTVRSAYDICTPPYSD